jgi:hypothetical protein
MCVASDDWSGSDQPDNGFDGSVAAAAAYVGIIPAASAGVDWAEVNSPTGAVDDRFVAAVVPGGPIRAEVEPSDLEDLGDLWRMYDGTAYLATL